MRKIASNGIQGRSEFAAEIISRNVKLYVPNERYSDALEILNNERFLVVIGEPGIGKTSLARMLTYELLSDDYQLVVIGGEIEDAETLWQTENKQVFYFDDFLGSNYLELLGSKNGDSKLVNFIKRVKEDPTKRLILTSRTTILNQATAKYTKLQDAAVDLTKHEVNIEDYNKFQKGEGSTVLFPVSEQRRLTRRTDSSARSASRPYPRSLSATDGPSTSLGERFCCIWLLRSGSRSRSRIRLRQKQPRRFGRHMFLLYFSQSRTR